MSDITRPHRALRHDDGCGIVFDGRADVSRCFDPMIEANDPGWGASRLNPSPLKAWWSQTGSNRRPPACKAGALPTELWPRTERRPRTGPMPDAKSMVGLGRLELPTSRLSSARSNQLSYKPGILTNSRRPAICHGTGLVREERETKTAVSRQWGV
jgi:hypothetical protein